jgi:hypothetical protein
MTLSRKRAELTLILLYYKSLGIEKAMTFVEWQHKRLSIWDGKYHQEMADAIHGPDKIDVEFLHPLVWVFGTGGYWILESIAALRKGLVVKQAERKQRQLDREIAQHPEGWGYLKPWGWQAQFRNGQWKCVRVQRKEAVADVQN